MTPISDFFESSEIGSRVFGDIGLPTLEHTSPFRHSTMRKGRKKRALRIAEKLLVRLLTQYSRLRLIRRWVVGALDEVIYCFVLIQAHAVSLQRVGTMIGGSVLCRTVIPTCIPHLGHFAIISAGSFPTMANSRYWERAAPAGASAIRPFSQIGQRRILRISCSMAPRFLCSLF